MVQYKNQHYVPQFYLKQFSKDSLTVNLYNIDSKKLSKKGVKNICSKSYFYVRSESFEECLSPLENIFSDVFDKLLNEKDLSILSDEEYIFLLYFICLQYVRTNKVKIESEEFWDAAYKGYLKEILSSAPKLAEDIGITRELIEKLEKWKILFTGSYDQSVSHLYGMILGLTGPFLIYDLEPLLVINNTNLDFIISDHPIILYNTFFNNKRETLLTGFASNGLQIFCPMSPKVMIVLYDKNFYEFNDRIQIVDLEEDITAINSLQFFNCHEIILFADPRQSDYLIRLHSELELLLNKNLEKFKWIICPSSFGLPTLYIKTSYENMNYNLKLSFMGLKEGSKIDAFCRNPEGLKEHERILASLEDRYRDLEI